MKFGYHRMLPMARPCSRIFSTTATTTVPQGSIKISSTPTPENPPLPFDDMPGPKGWPILGIIPDYVRYGDRIAELYEKYHKEHGPIFRMNIFGREHVMVGDLNLIEKVYRLNTSFPKRLPIDLWVNYRRKHGIPASVVWRVGEDWKRIRVVVAQLLKPAVVDMYAPRIIHVAKEWADMLEKKVVQGKQNHLWENWLEDSQKFSLEAFGALFLGRRLQLFSNPSEKVSKFAYAAARLFSSTADVIFSLPLWRYFDTPAVKRHYQFASDSFKYGYQILHATDEIDISKEDGVENFMEVIKKNETLTEKERDATMFDLLAASVDTTSVALRNILYIMSVNPEEQEKLYDNITEVMGNETKLTHELLDKMDFTRNIVMEAMRIMPALPVNSRLFDDEVILGGYRIPPNTPIMTNVIHGGVDEKYTPNAKQFCPHRYSKKLQEQGQVEKPHPYASGTFGAGVRMCPGRRIAELELQAAIVELFRRFKVVYTHSKPPPITYTLFYTPVVDKTNGLYITLQPRSS